MIRQPICTVVGHINHGKTSMLDRIRGTAVAKSEAGKITQSISCTSLSLDVIKKICGNLLDKLKIKLTLPGILFIDTPGHAAFNNLRKRGGNLADIAILVIDINEGIKDQTLECIEILKHYKTPFVIALNKVDLVSGWQQSKSFLLENINRQSERTQKDLDNKLYTLVGKLSELGFSSERFDRVSDYTKEIAIIPISSKTGEGIAELLMVLTGLAQKYLEKSLNVVKGAGKGTILEVKEVKGVGITLDVILYDGSLKKGDKIIIGGIDKPIVTNIKGLFILDKKKLKAVDQVSAAIGVKISAPELKDVVSGMPLKVVENLEKDKKEIQKEVDEVLIETDKKGVIIKADSLGSLEALISLLKGKGIPIKKAKIGDINKKDIAEANSIEDPLLKVVLGFNVKSIKSDIKIITHNVIYQIIEEYEKWRDAEIKKEEAKELEKVVMPCKMQIMPGCVFRQSHPAVVGVRILEGKLKPNTEIIKGDGSKCSYVKSIQSEGENVAEAKKNDEVAISIPNVTVGRQIDENDTLLSNIHEEDFKKLKKMKKFLNRGEIEVLKEIAELKRKEKAMWGI